MTPLRSGLLLVACALGFGVAVAGAPPEARADSAISSLSSSPVTVYSAKWCSACKALASGLGERKIAFETVDVDENPAAFARARDAAHAASAIPLTGIARSSGTVWVVGADVDAVDRAQRGE